MKENRAEERQSKQDNTPQRGLLNRLNLEKRVKSLHQEKIRSLQQEVVAISLQNKDKRHISSLLEEIKKLRELLKCTG